jgi:uncharacterized protein (DUF362 family)
MSKVVLIRGNNPEKMVDKGLNELGINRHRHKAVIKPNLIINRPPPVTTSVDTIEAIVKYFIKETEEIVIAEGSGWGETKESFQDLGYEEIAKRHRVKLVDLNRDKYELRQCKQAMVLKGMEFPLTLIDSYLISVASLKTHSFTKVTLSLKNMLGATIGEVDVTAGRKRRFHRLGLNESIVDLSLYKRPDLAIIDGRQACLGGELSGMVKRLDIMIFSEDPVAADAIGTKIIDHDPMYVKHLRLAQDAGLGIADLSGIKIKEII